MLEGAPFECVSLLLTQYEMNVVSVEGVQVVVLSQYFAVCLHQLAGFVFADGDFKGFVLDLIIHFITEFLESNSIFIQAD